MELAPIVIFAYNRADHLERTIMALKENEEAKKSLCYIFSDGYKNEIGRKKVLQVRDYIKSIPKEYFKDLVIIEAPKNKGLAKSIISGVGEIISRHGKAIIVEDDVITSKNFLKFMNNALNFYQDNSRVWSIGGYTVPMKLPVEYNHDVLAVQRCSSYCWATWYDRWQKIDWDIKGYRRFRFNFFARRAFNRYGTDRSLMLDDQMNKRVDSWAIRFDYNMWKNRAINILPCKSLSNNIGHDGSGTHSKITQEEDIFAIDLTENHKEIVFDNVDLVEDIRKEYVRFFNMSLYQRTKRYLGNLVITLKRKIRRGE